jgi:hypothetical protein
VIILVAPLTWLHHYVLALPVWLWCFIFWREQFAQGRVHWLFTAGLLLILLCFAAPYMVSWIFTDGALEIKERGMSFGRNLMLSSQWLSGLALWVFYTVLLVTRAPDYNAIAGSRER